MSDAELRPTPSWTPPIRVNEHSTDLTRAREVLASAYNGVAWHADRTDHAFSFRYAAAGDEAMTLRAVQFDGHLDGEMPESRDFVVQWITRGSGVLDDGNRQISLNAGRPQMWPNTAFEFVFENYDQRLVQVNRTAVELIAQERGLGTADLRFDYTAKPDDRALQLWKSSVQLISHTVLDRQASPLLQAEMSRLGAISLLELYPVVSGRLPDELLLPRNAHLRRAVEYAHEYAHLPITSNELADVASLSVRTLQNAFQRHLGVSPNRYLRQIRLDRVREALLRADPASATIAKVAGDWGFAHLGRFSGAYLERYGEYPRDTLRRSR